MKKDIIATLGPASLDKKTIRNMDYSGVDLFRINLSHTEINDFEHIIRKVQNWTAKPVCPDTEGAQLRTGSIEGGQKKVETHETIVFVDTNKNSTINCIPLSINNINNILKPCDIMKIDFDSVIVQLKDVQNHYVSGRVISGGIIGSNKGISIDREINLPCFTKKDIEAFNIASELQLKTIFLSFCSNANDVIKLRTYFNYEINIISKIESKTGLENLSEICKESDGILIDRGDLSRDVPLEKIAYAQKYILNKAKEFNTDVYIATNLMESMIEKSKPTRAEINDIVNVLETGAKGLVLAAETAIGKYPVDCVRIMSRIIDEVEKFNYYNYHESINSLFSLPSDRITNPHGGKLIQQHNKDINDEDLLNIFSIEIDANCESDIIQICEGTYSPITSFMNIEELISVLNNNMLPSGINWTLPILFQLNKREIESIPHNGEIALRSKMSGKIIAILYIDNIQKIDSINNIANKWFGTDNIDHPGVFQFLNEGDYILSGKPFLVQKNKCLNMHPYELTPKQTRDIFNQKGWHDIIGFHTRNVCHSGHEYIQIEALKSTEADAIFISPVTGKKKKDDFTSEIIVQCYEELIKKGVYDPYGVLLGSFNTFSRYSGPREAVFTALCRKNYGCNYFIVGRDHTGVGNYYKSNDSIKIFDKLDIGMNILKFDTAYYCQKTKQITNNSVDQKQIKSALPISGTIIRDSLKSKNNIPDYIMNKEIIKMINKKYEIDPSRVLVN